MFSNKRFSSLLKNNSISEIIFFKNEKILSYVGFIKKHPHDSFSIIRIVFKDNDNSNVENIKILLSSCADKAIEIYDNLNRNFI